MEGWLYKKSSWHRHGEKRRWFSLDADKRELSYFKVMQVGKHPQSVGSIRMGTIQLAEAVSVDDGEAGAGALDIVTPNHVYELRAESPDMAHRWVAALKPLVGAKGGRTAPARTAEPPVPVPALRYTPPKLCSPAVPWSVTAVWLDGQHHGADHHEDADVSIVAELGAVPESELRTKVLLSDATTLLIDAAELGLIDGKFHEVATAGNHQLLARLIQSEAGKGGAAAKGEARPVERTSPGVATPLLCGMALALGLVALFPELMVKLALPLTFLISLVAFYLLRGEWQMYISGKGTQAPAAAANDAGKSSERTWRLELKSVTQEADRPEVLPRSSSKQRLSHPQRQPSMTLDQVRSSDLQPPAKLPPGLVDFTGTWQLSLARSDDPTEMLKALKVPYVARVALKRCDRQVVIEHDGLEWTETNVTPVIRKTTNMMLDGSTHQEISPVDNKTVLMVSNIEEGGACVVTKATYSDGKTHVTRRYLRDDGRTYWVNQTMHVSPSETITCNNYFDLVLS